MVCGWFKNEFDMFGANMRPHDDRYKYATEWLDFLKQAWTRHEEFDFSSESFKQPPSGASQSRCKSRIHR